jgi:hypothetical protein
LGRQWLVITPNSAFGSPVEMPSMGAMSRQFSGSTSSNNDNSRSSVAGDTHYHNWNMPQFDIDHILADHSSRRKFEGYVKNSMRAAGRRVR